MADGVSARMGLDLGRRRARKKWNGVFAGGSNAVWILRGELWGKGSIGIGRAVIGSCFVFVHAPSPPSVPESSLAHNPSAGTTRH